MTRETTIDSSDAAKKTIDGGASQSDEGGRTGETASEGPPSDDAKKAMESYLIALKDVSSI